MLRRLLSRIFSRKPGLREAFTEVYRRNIWRGDESRSGKGSGLAQTEAVRRELPPLLHRLGVGTLLDASCGDFFWMSQVELGDVRYTGVDIVEEMIAENERRHGAATRRFLCLDVTRGALPRADLVLCRDCLVHLTLERALAAVANFKRSGATYLLATTFTGRRENHDFDAALGWRPLNLQLPPFNFPAPVALIDEQYSGEEGRFRDKSLGLWRLADLT